MQLLFHRFMEIQERSPLFQTSLHLRHPQQDRNCFKRKTKLRSFTCSSAEAKPSESNERVAEPPRGVGVMPGRGTLQQSWAEGGAERPLSTARGCAPCCGAAGLKGVGQCIKCWLGWALGGIAVLPTSAINSLKWRSEFASEKTSKQKTNYVYICVCIYMYLKMH